MVRDFHPERTDARGLQKNQRALENLLHKLFDRASGEELFVVLAGRSGGQTILQGVTLEGGVVVNDLGADVDFRVEGDTEPNLLFVDASTGRVGIGTASPSSRLDVRSGADNANIFIIRNAAGAISVRLFVTAAGDGLYSLFDNAGAERFRLSSVGTSWMSPANLAIFSVAGSFGGGVGVLFLANRSTAPTSNPTGGALLWAESGAPRSRTSGGLIGEMLYKSSSAADPTTTELPAAGDAGIHKNTSSGAVFLAYNDGGSTIKKVALT